MKTPRLLLCAWSLLAARPALAQEDLARWHHWRAVKLDTTASGAGVKGDVAHFPVPVVLDAGNFDFAQAARDGADLRFSKTAPGGEALPYSIEHWDADAKSAVVWVKVDVKGNDKKQSFVMHWGNPDARDASDSKKVFDVKEGWVGVYHLGEPGNAAAEGYKDATANEAHMTGVNTDGGARGEGRLGKGLELTYAKVQWLKLDHPKKVKAFNLTTRGTFSIWAKARSYQNQGDEKKKALPGYETMFAKGDNSWRLQKYGVRDWHKPPADLIEMCVEQPPSADLCVPGKTDMVTGRWFQVVAVHDFPKAKLYVNGVLDQASTFDVNWISDVHPVGIGNQSQFPEKGRQWDGWLDEARVSNVARNDDWLKLDYESQREGAKLLVFGKTQSR
jgi:biopolymer transport protein ExbB